MNFKIQTHSPFKSQNTYKKQIDEEKSDMPLLHSQQTTHYTLINNITPLSGKQSGVEFPDGIVEYLEQDSNDEKKYLGMVDASQLHGCSVDSYIYFGEFISNGNSKLLCGGGISVQNLCRVIYIGNFIQGQREGFGMKITYGRTSPIEIFIGQHKNNMRNGFGVLISNISSTKDTSEIQIGEWIDNNIDSQVYTASQLIDISKNIEGLKSLINPIIEKLNSKLNEFNFEAETTEGFNTAVEFINKNNKFLHIISSKNFTSKEGIKDLVKNNLIFKNEKNKSFFSRFWA